jgi:hypothetical protein
MTKKYKKIFVSYFLFLLMMLSFIFLGSSVFLLIFDVGLTAAMFAQLGSVCLVGGSIIKSIFL